MMTQSRSHMWVRRFFNVAVVCQAVTCPNPLPSPQLYCCGDAAMHDLDPVFRSWCRSDKVAALLRALGFRRPLPVQSMYILKVRLCVHSPCICSPGTSNAADAALQT